MLRAKPRYCNFNIQCILHLLNSVWLSGFLDTYTTKWFRTGLSIITYQQHVHLNLHVNLYLTCQKIEFDLDSSKGESKTLFHKES